MKPGCREETPKCQHMAVSLSRRASWSFSRLFSGFTCLSDLVSRAVSFRPFRRVFLSLAYQVLSVV